MQWRTVGSDGVRRAQVGRGWRGGGRRRRGWRAGGRRVHGGFARGRIPGAQALHGQCAACLPGRLRAAAHPLVRSQLRQAGAELLSLGRRLQLAGTRFCSTACGTTPLLPSEPKGIADRVQGQVIALA